jgi:hypothetical protein
MPVPWVNIITILLLLVNESLMGDLKDLVHHLRALGGLSELLSLLILLSHEVVSLAKSLDFTIHLLLH